MSEAEIKSITGLDQPAAQEQMLTAMGLRVFRNRANKVVLIREAFVRWQLGDKVQAPQNEPKLRPIGHGKAKETARRHG